MMGLLRLQQRLMDVRQHATITDRHVMQQPGQLLVRSHRQLDVTRVDAGLQSSGGGKTTVRIRQVLILALSKYQRW